MNPVGLINLHDKEAIAKMSSELNLGTSSLMFYSDQFEQLYNDLINKDVTVGDI